MSITGVFTEDQKTQVKQTLAQIWTGRGKKVEDISKEINESMFPLSDQKIEDVNDVVEALVYGGGFQDTLSLPERLEFGLEYITQKIAT